MNPDFRLHYDRLRENDPTKPENGANEAGTFYDAPGPARNLCLVWPDGKRQFLNYAYLIGGSFTPGEETNEISLNFTVYTVTIKGHGLETLFTAMLDYLPQQVTQADARYVQATNSQDAMVTCLEVSFK